MRKIRDPELLDRLQALTPQPFARNAWRMARSGRDPLVATNPKGRWDDGSFEVLYAALEADAARAEVNYHLTRGQPVFPSALQIHLYEFAADLKRVLWFENLDALLPYSVDAENYGKSDYAKLQAEYSVTQQMGEAAHFLGVQALVVPSARWPGHYLVVMATDKLKRVKDHGSQDLKAWARRSSQ
jgi:RES domain-containing protein